MSSGDFGIIIIIFFTLLNSIGLIGIFLISMFHVLIVFHMPVKFAFLLNKSLRLEVYLLLCYIIIECFVNVGLTQAYYLGLIFVLLNVYNSIFQSFMVISPFKS
jgi:hypothetical protein